MKRAAGAGSPRGWWLERLAVLPCRMGEVLIARAESGEFDLRHREDAGRADLATNFTEDAVAEIARYDDADKYRPLKTAPSLRHGWRLLLPDATAVGRALDFFYPGRSAVLMARENGRLVITPLRDKLERQTGMYRAAARISDPAADELVARFCRSDGGCLRTICWRRDATASTLLPANKFDPSYDQTGRGEDAIPLLCPEACNLLVAEARNVVKAAAEQL